MKICSFAMLGWHRQRVSFTSDKAPLVVVSAYTIASNPVLRSGKRGVALHPCNAGVQTFIARAD
ncbi:MAG: hypothetical protein HXX08_01470 [Chloroflexi bacterium]|uniref:Uncharacterized protein n=1 Tax=Candidatus Chlorohelix allophototropha TaxID=3003348 RepID=A0A8T7M1F3_9CHLR|nr:hypothetical protein [Chloroflexota bacterium]WJW66418.1 hypothetical protein OZ401_002215 [Chloroflexota bacterium L227-S17]